MRWWLKSCSKCGGDLYEQQGDYERVIQCFQCGRIVPDREELGLRKRRFGASGAGLTREKVLTRMGARSYDRAVSEETESEKRRRAA